MTDVHHPHAIDPEAEVARAKRELRRRLEPYMPADTARRLADRYLDDLTAEGWRPPARQRPWRTDRRADPETTHRGAELARQTLAARRGETAETQEGHQQ